MKPGARLRHHRARTGRAGTSHPGDTTGILPAPQQPRVLVPAESRSGLRDGFDTHLRSTGLFLCRERASHSPQRHRLASRHSRRAGRWSRFRFRADQPLCAISRWLCLDSRASARANGRHRESGRPGLRSGLDRGQRRGAEQPSRTGTVGATSRPRSIVRFYTSLMGDAPFPSATVALIESDCPAATARASSPCSTSRCRSRPVNWRGDPASFENFPEFFLAHELAHQWWGQAIGWKNYHEQWLSEGLRAVFRGAVRAEGARRRSASSTCCGSSAAGPSTNRIRARSISATGSGTSRATRAVFRALVYNKGAAVLHMLRRLLGDEVFFAGLRRFYADRRFQKAGTDDLQRAMEAAVGPRPRSVLRALDLRHRHPPHPLRHRRLATAGRSCGSSRPATVFDIPVTVTLTYADGRTQDVVVPSPSDSLVERVHVPTERRRSTGRRLNRFGGPRRVRRRSRRVAGRASES